MLNNYSEDIQALKEISGLVLRFIAHNQAGNGK